MNFLDNFGPILTAAALVIGAVGIYIQRRTSNVSTFAEGWQRYSEKLEKSIELKDKRISYLEIQNGTLMTENGTLRNELLKYKKIDGKIEDVKASIHESVETNIEDLKIKKDIKS